MGCAVIVTRRYAVVLICSKTRSFILVRAPTPPGLNLPPPHRREGADADVVVVQITVGYSGGIVDTIAQPGRSLIP